MAPAMRPYDRDQSGGELRLRGDGLATSYWRDGQEEPICSEDLWFNTDDLVQYSKGCYKIWGRLNMKNVNHKGTHVDAVKVEKTVLSNKDVEDCYVLGLGDIQVQGNIRIIAKVNLYEFYIL